MSRSPDLATSFSAAGAEAVAEAATRCADPASCGSEFQADGFSSRTATCTRCGLQGVLDLELEAAVPMSSIAGTTLTHDEVAPRG
ncbi:hypothetical protein BHAOGJBA_0626 [Methylobacterium hispanicum]|uniref:Uncharacterized protein n=1 Tax=Methylobacterium hispanicum TaxID=270350 RepID=A0AAV4ZFD2_9HYPH|nr:hypothetical protein [Methylobacterium hispanicum]GJD87126.1 hypothetical protein BHAOGJBA_0626 [Methylobacterium hispanicum]